MNVFIFKVKLSKVNFVLIQDQINKVNPFKVNRDDASKVNEMMSKIV